MVHWRIWLTLSTLILGSPLLRAAEPPPGIPEPVPALITDRPTFGEAAAAIPDDFVQFEFGAEFDNDQAGRALSLPLLLARWGLGGGFELRFGIPSLLATWPKNEIEAGESQTELGSLTLGARYVYELSEAVAIGISPYVALPLKGDQYDSVGVAAGARLVWGVAASDWLSVGGNFGLSFTGLGTSGSDREYLASLSLSFAASESLGVFAEVFTVIDERFSDEAPVTVDAGLTWLATERFQADVYVGMDMRAAPDAVFVGLGGAYLW